MRRLLPVLTVLALVAMALPSTGSSPGHNVCRSVDENDATAQGQGAVLQILQGPGAPYTLSDVQATQAGPGVNGANNQTGYVFVGNVVRLTVAPSRTDVQVQRDPLAARTDTTAQVLDVDILDGLVTADIVKAATFATADVRSAETDSGSSTMVGVKVRGVSITRIEPGINVDLSVPFGSGSFVKIFERVDASKFPNRNSIYWEGDVTVRMIHVYLKDHDLTQLGDQPLEVVVGLSRSYAKVPTPYCSVLQYVGASAYIARVRPHGGWVGGVLVGDQGIGPVGGQAGQQLAGQAIPSDGETLNVQASQTRAWGEIRPGVDSRGSAMAKVTGVCLVQNNTNDCLVSATLIKSESHTYADAQRAASWGHTTIANLTVAGVDVCKAIGLDSVCSPPINTKVTIAGIEITLNERQRDSPQPGHSGLAVRAVHISSPALGDIYLARSYSEASYYDLGH